MKFVWLVNEFGNTTCELWVDEGFSCCSARRRKIVATYEVELPVKSLADYATQFLPPG